MAVYALAIGIEVEGFFIAQQVHQHMNSRSRQLLDGVNFTIDHIQLNGAGVFLGVPSFDAVS